LDILEKQAVHQVVGLLDDFKPVGTTLFGYEVVGSVSDVVRLTARLQADGLLVAIGDNFIRSQLAARLKSLAPQLSFITAVHPSAQIARGVTLGGGSVVMAGVVINSDSAIGESCILNSNCSVDHDNRIGSFSSLAPRVATGGNVALDEGSAVGIGAVILHGRKIGQHAIVGAGSVVTRDVPDFTVAYGVPAKVVRSRTVGEKYL
jgi:sugar O-acyltransferase (sialic acid O-acetyltransferase NeuD family)